MKALKTLRSRMSHSRLNGKCQASSTSLTGMPKAKEENPENRSTPDTSLHPQDGNQDFGIRASAARLARSKTRGGPKVGHMSRLDLAAAVDPFVNPGQASSSPSLSSSADSTLVGSSNGENSPIVPNSGLSLPGPSSARSNLFGESDNRAPHPYSNGKPWKGVLSGKEGLDGEADDIMGLGIVAISPDPSFRSVPLSQEEKGKESERLRTGKQAEGEREADCKEAQGEVPVSDSYNSDLGESGPDAFSAFPSPPIRDTSVYSGKSSPTLSSPGTPIFIAYTGPPSSSTPTSKGKSIAESAKLTDRLPPPIQNLSKWPETAPKSDWPLGILQSQTRPVLKPGNIAEMSDLAKRRKAAREAEQETINTFREHQQVAGSSKAIWSPVQGEGFPEGVSNIVVTSPDRWKSPFTSEVVMADRMSATNAARLSSQKRSSNVNLALAAAQQQNRMSVVQPQARRHSTLLYLKDGKPIAPASARYSIAPQPNATVSAWPSGSGEVVPPSLPKRLRPLENVPSHASLTQEKAMNAVQRAPMLRALNAGTGVAPMRHVSIGGQTARKAASSSLQYSSSVDAPESKSEDRTIRQSSEPPMPSPGARSNASTAQSSPRFGTPTLSISVEEAKPMPSSPSNQIRTHPPNMACFAGCCHSQRESSEVAPMSFIQLDEPPRSPLLPTTPSTLADLSPSPTSSIPNSNTSGNLPNSPTLRTVGSKSSLRKLASLGNLKLSKNNPSAKNDIVPTSSWSSTSEGQGKEQQENQGGGAKTQGSTTTPSDSTSLPAGTSGCDSLPTTATTATTPKRKGTLKRVGKSLTRINKALVKAVVSPGNCGGPSSTSFSVTSATAANPAPLAVSNQDCKERGEGNRKSSDEESEVWGPRTELGDDCFDGTLECISPPCIDRQARAGEAVDKATCVGELKAQSEGTSLPWASSGPNEDMDQDRFADAVESIDPMDGGLFPDPKYDFGPPQIRMLSCSSQDPDSTASTAEMSLPFGFGIGLAMLGGNDGRHRNEARSLFSYQSSYIPTSRPDREARYNTCITGPRDRIGSGTKSASSGTTTPSLVSSSPTFTDKSESERGTPASEEEDAERGEDEEGKRFETPISSPWLSDNGKVHWVHQPDDCRKSRNQYDESMEFLTDQNNRTSQNGCGQDESSISVQTRTGGPAFEKVGGFRVNFPIQVLPPLDSIGFYVGRH